MDETTGTDEPAAGALLTAEAGVPGDPEAPSDEEVSPATEEAPAGPLPTAEDVRVLLNGLFDRQVTVEEQDGPELLGRAVQVVGCYVDDDEVVRAVALCDQVAGCVLGAGLALLPEDQVRRALGTGRVPPELADGAREVLNVASSLFPGDVPLRLRSVQVAPEPVPDDVVALLRRVPERADLRLDVPGYGSGLVVLLRESA